MARYAASSSAISLIDAIEINRIPPTRRLTIRFRLINSYKVVGPQPNISRAIFGLTQTLSLLFALEGSRESGIEYICSAPVLCR
jgi:hypothetical protein